MLEYSDFLSSRLASAPQAGFVIKERDLHPSLFPFQRHAVTTALRLGRAAMFEDTGLGKSRQILEWMRHVVQHTNGRALLLVPLAVAHQFVRTEAPALGIELAYCRSQAEADVGSCRLVVTNYEMASRFDPSQFAGVALDEADIISNFVGKTNRLLTEMFKATPYRLVATATPAPNDLIELGRYSQFLGIMESGEMLTRYFIRDSQSAATLRLRHWADAGPFWDWLTSWAICIGLPSDLNPNYSDDGYLLPPLDIQQHTVDVDYGRALAQGQLFPDSRQSATNLWATKHETFQARCELSAELVARKPTDPWIVWCSTDEESRLLCKLIPDAVEVKGSHTPEQKEDRLVAFTTGEARILVTKPKIAGQGLNFQHCADMVYCSPTFSFRHFYQGLRRVYRFRQLRRVTCHVVIAETEENVIAAVDRKQAQHRQMHAQARAAMRRQRALAGDWRVAEGDARPLIVPQWLKAA
jgi:helicase-like protein